MTTPEPAGNAAPPGHLPSPALGFPPGSGALAPDRPALAPRAGALSALEASMDAAPGGVPPVRSVLEALDSLLNTGVLADGQIVLSLAGVDLVFIGLRALVASVETAARMGARQ